MTYNLNIWREDQRLQALHFCRAFSTTLWSYGSPELDVLGWQAFYDQGEWLIDPEGFQYRRVTPSNLLGWLLQLSEIQSKAPEQIPVYYQLWKVVSPSAMSSTDLFFKYHLKTYHLMAEEFEFWIKECDSERIDLDLTQKIAETDLAQALTEGPQADRLDLWLRGSQFKLERAPVFEYFKKELQQLQQLAEAAAGCQVGLCHDCS